LNEHPEIVHDVREAIHQVVGSSLVGLYACGSLVTENFEPQVSDVDFIAVLESEPDDQLVSRLRSMHARIERASPAWADRVEVDYVSARGLAHCRTGSTLIARISPGEPIHLLEAGREFLLDWVPARQEGVALVGPPISSLIPVIPPDEYLAEVRAHLKRFPGWIDDGSTPGSQAYAILTVSRGLYTLRTGHRPSKREAADWAKHEFPHRSRLIDEALGWRAHQWDDVRTDRSSTIAATRGFIDEMLTYIDAGPDTS
jgi:hypothetical protein